MQPEPDAPTAARPPSAVRDLQVIVVALLVAVLLSRIVGGVARTGGLPSPVAQVLVADLAVWVPLALGVGWVLRKSAPAALVRRLGLGWADAVAAIGIVIVCRGLDAVLSVAFFGVTGLTPQPTLGTPDVLLLVVSAIGVCLVSPVLEEIVFRGVMQRRLSAELTPRTRFLAVLVTAFAFALMHLAISTPASSVAGFEVFVTTFVLGLLTGTLVAMTGRIGGAVLAHVLFNTVAVVLTWPR
ncbi:CPBP family intramembrane metalloprotease [Curtobacterium sp. TC1]|uniref:CPBP family intramembrane glutamic endopeptidase n=1 Tax=Curtobacterium sp. TC1 TaxID=2862880 RepID=UPI001C9B6749|nr:CPBP family intramembrane glutamic endopeptidase [Curtobacterium sp. TC1]QZQ56076.1 CPBP family intramembrane metalloprotease [Curtobacterium sp. TC1]